MAANVFWKCRGRRAAIAISLGFASLFAVPVWSQGNRILTFINQCDQTVWIGSVGGSTGACTGTAPNYTCPAGQACGTSASPPQCFWVLSTPESGTLELAAGKSTTVSLSAPPQGTTKWSGHVYGSTGCNASGQSCQTGACVGGACSTGTGPVGPTTLAEFTLITNGPDTYDISMINGVNLPLEMAPTLPAASSGNPYQCGNPGGSTPSNKALVGCSWSFNPVVNGKDYSNVLRMVSLGGKACKRDSDCAAPEVCGLAMVIGTLDVQQVCGQPIGWWGANEICGYTNSRFDSPFNCKAAVSGQGNKANLYACNGSNGNAVSCYNDPSGSTSCCGCPQWVINGTTLPSSLPCQATNPAWTSVAEPWAQFLKAACPMAYSFQYDDGTSTFTCATTGTSSTQLNTQGYTITYCPGGATIFPRAGAKAVKPAARKRR
jgi:hypothetical protein